jgi:hypothetical protein
LGRPVRTSVAKSANAVAIGGTGIGGLGDGRVTGRVPLRHHGWPIRVSRFCYGTVMTLQGTQSPLQPPATPFDAQLACAIQPAASSTP